MQVQKKFNSFELYSDRTSKSNFIEMKFGKKVVISFLIAISVSLLVCTVVAANIAFDNSVFAASPDYSLNSPEYSSYNTAFSGIKPAVTLSLVDRGGDKLVLSTEAVKLSEILYEQNIVLDDSCVVNYSLDTTVFDGMEVIIDSVTYEEVTVEAVLPYNIETVELQTIPKGRRDILTKGVDGTAANTYLRKYVNGIYRSEELLDQVVLVEPVTEVVRLGVGGTFVGKDGKTYNYSYYLDCQATCYGKADGSGSITATGTVAREGVIAVDPRVIPLGSTVYVTGPYREIGVCYAEDTGGAIKGNIIDVYLEGTLEELFEFGRRNMRVYVLEK